MSDIAGELGALDIATLRARAKGFDLVGYELELTGYCSDCAPPKGNGTGASAN
jgi:Fe2+ or Zn2+ uptake regulation protein